MPEEQIQPQLPDPEDFEFGKENLRKLYAAGEARTINPDRWVRVKEKVLFSDLVEELTGHRGSAISCPFHGSDSRPSFYLYPPSRGNCGYCFGCAPYGTYDHFRFVSQIMGISRVRALIWIEKNWDLPPMEDVLVEDDSEEVTVSLEYKDLVPAYLSLAQRDCAANRDPQLAEEYLRIYFEAEKSKSHLPLANVLGRERVRTILHRKARLVR